MRFYAVKDKLHQDKICVDRSYYRAIRTICHVIQVHLAFRMANNNCKIIQVHLSDVVCCQAW